MMRNNGKITGHQKAYAPRSANNNILHLTARNARAIEAHKPE